MTPAKQFDYLIVGQGLAGSLLAFFLHQKENACWWLILAWRILLPK
ncbi:MAG: hypothetical protein IPL49_20845 [Saprospirales bacterium]|nr:hypothetical protein [Saprospirales bacterium]